MKHSLLLAMAGAMLLSGCSSLPRYVPPSADLPQATVDVSLLPQPSVCVAGKLYSANKGPDGRISVPATGARVAIHSFVYIDDYNVSYSCYPGISFRPEEGAGYTTRVEIEDQKCRLEVYREGAKNRVGLDLVESIGPPYLCK